MCLRRFSLTVRFLFLALISSLVFLPLLGQTAQLRGRVLDPTGAVVPKASLTLTDDFTTAGLSRESDLLGRFAFLQLAPGRYTLEVQSAGFKVHIQKEIRLEVDSSLTLDVTLEVGEITESVTVVGSQPLLNKSNGTLGNVLPSEQIQGIPLNSRNIADALRLQPGVTLSGEVTGSRADQINLTLDGIDVNDQYYGTNFGEEFQPVLRVTPDSIQEFRMVTSNPNATQGRSSGAQVSFVTRSGTNAFHGSFYNYHRNTVTTANDFFNNRAEGDPDKDGKPGIARPNLIRNVFGGSAGGPIVRDKVFFFVNYEGRKDRSETTQLNVTPLAHLGEGRMAYLNKEGRRVELEPETIAALYPATGGVNPAIVHVLEEAARKYPANDNGVGDQFNTGGYRFNAATPLDWNALTAKLDFNLAENQSLFIRGNYQWDLEATGALWPDTPSPGFWSHPTGASLGHTWTIRPTLINSFRYGFTRQAWSQTGDSDENFISFRGVFQPRYFERSNGATFPVQNITNDTSWIYGNHTFQFGTNIRMINTNRSGYEDSYDEGLINFFWGESGCLSAPLEGTDLLYSPGQKLVYDTAISALLGRYNRFTFLANYKADGSLRPAGSPWTRSFETREYEFYFEDSWQATPRLTLNLGIRWGVYTPLSETTGFQVQPTTSLSRYFDRRVQGAMQGVPYNDSISFDRSGPFYDRPGYYPTDWNNFGPRMSFAWSPSAGTGALKTILGEQGRSVFRGGFAVLYDRAGTALAMSFDGSNLLGFTDVIYSKELYNVTDRLGPLFTGFDQDIRPLSEETPSDKITFPRTQPIPGPGSYMATTSLDDDITAPVNYNWNLSFGRELPGGMFFEVSYVGRSARNLLASRDIMQFNNLVDPASGIDWYTAAETLYNHRINNTPIDQVPDIPFFENLFPDLPQQWWPGLTSTQNAFAIVSRDGLDWLDWTNLQYLLDLTGIHPNMFAQPQYAALTAWSTIARSNYNAMTATLRKRFRESLAFDFNYTWAKSMDTASARQDADLYGLALIRNALRPEDAYSVSDFDVQHIVNSNWVWQLPFGRGRRWLNAIPKGTDAVLGGWSLTGIFRWNSGLPMGSPYELGRWATNFNTPSWGTRLRDPKADPHKSGEHPNFWADPLYAYNSYRDAKAGETGDRNVLRIPSYFSLDLGVRKAFRMPYAEDHRLLFACEAFNVTNTQRLGPTGLRRLGTDPQIALEPTPGFGNINQIQGIPRVVQFSLRYEF